LRDGSTDVYRFLRMPYILFLHVSDCNTKFPLSDFKITFCVLHGRRLEKWVSSFDCSCLMKLSKIYDNNKAFDAISPIELRYCKILEFIDWIYAKIQFLMSLGNIVTCKDVVLKVF